MYLDPLQLGWFSFTAGGSDRLHRSTELSFKVGR